MAKFILNKSEVDRLNNGSVDRKKIRKHIFKLSNDLGGSTIEIFDEHGTTYFLNDSSVPLHCPDNIKNLIKYIDSATDRYGEELVSYVLYRTAEPNFYDKYIPPEHKDARDAFVKYSPYQQERIVRAVLEI